jgi:hypothetical protein
MTDSSLMIKWAVFKKIIIANQGTKRPYGHILINYSDADKFNFRFMAGVSIGIE